MSRAGCRTARALIALLSQSSRRRRRVVAFITNITDLHNAKKSFQYFFACSVQFCSLLRLFIEPGLESSARKNRRSRQVCTRESRYILHNLCPVFCARIERKEKLFRKKNVPESILRFLTSFRVFGYWRRSLLFFQEKRLSAVLLLPFDVKGVNTKCQLLCCLLFNFFFSLRSGLICQLHVKRRNSDKKLNNFFHFTSPHCCASNL